MRVGYVDTLEHHYGHWYFPDVSCTMAEYVRAAYREARSKKMDRALVKEMIRVSMLAACGGNRTFVDPVITSRNP